MSQPDHIKLVIVGDGAVGKSCLLITWSTGTFPREYVPTVFDNYASTIRINGKETSLGLWDTAGQEDYDELRPLSYTGAHVFFVCFSVANRTSFENIKHKWMPEVRKYSPESQFVLIGTKSDLRGRGEDFERHVTTEEGNQLAKELKMYRYCETSSLENKGLKECFDHGFLSVTYGPKSSSSSGGGIFGGIFSSLFGGSKAKNGVRKPVPPVMPETGRSPWLNVDESTYSKDFEKLLKDDNCDLNIITKDDILTEKTTTFNAHKIVLAVSSPYFKEILNQNNNNEKEVEKDENYVKFYNKDEKKIYMSSHVTSDVFKFILEFYYLGNFKTIPTKKQRKSILSFLNSEYFPEQKEEKEQVKDEIIKILENLENLETPGIGEEEKNFFLAINNSLQTYLMDRRSNEYRKYYNNKQFSDVIFKLDNLQDNDDEEENEGELLEEEEEEKKLIYLHKSLLFCRNEYFRTMLTSNFIESKQKKVEILEDKDIHKEVSYFLQFLYTSHTFDFINNKNALKMLKIGNKFMNHRLISFCEIFVSKLVERECSEKIEKSEVDIIGILIFAYLHNAEQLKNFCLHFISSNYQCFRRRKEWEDLVNEKELYEYVEKNQWPPKSYLKAVKEYQKELEDYYTKIGKKVPKKEINFLKKDILKDMDNEGNEEEEEEVVPKEKKIKEKNISKKSKGGLFSFLF